MPHFGTILDCSSFTPSSQPNGSAIHYAIPLLASVRIYPHHQVRGLAQIVSWGRVSAAKPRRVSRETSGAQPARPENLQPAGLNRRGCELAQSEAEMGESKARYYQPDPGTTLDPGSTQSVGSLWTPSGAKAGTMCGNRVAPGVMHYRRPALMELPHEIRGHDELLFCPYPVPADTRNCPRRLHELAGGEAGRCKP